MDDVDYYPDEYLNRLAHDGTNGIWIYTRLADLVRTDIIPEYGENAEKRIAKLNRVVARCKRYGIGVYVFFIDPAFLTKETAEFVHHSPEDIIVMENYEDMGTDIQLGKERLAVDYWLSYLGPSSRFEAAQQVAMKENKTIYAKLQVCCSHECATLPYIPVPGILFDKYNSTFEGVMQCWYFGNYPSLMSKTAGELSFLHDFSDKNSFLEFVAGIYFGKSKAKAAAKAWKCFEEAYKNYPTNITFSYYGPMHDGVVWELQLEPKNNRLPRTWLYLDTADGDRIYECDVEKGKYVITVRKDDVRWGEKWPVRFKTVSNYGVWSPSANEIPRLGIGKSPFEFGRIIEQI